MHRLVKSSITCALSATFETRLVPIVLVGFIQRQEHQGGFWISHLMDHSCIPSVARIGICDLKREGIITPRCCKVTEFQKSRKVLT